MMWRRRLTGQHYGTRIKTTARPIPFGGDQRGLPHPEVIVYHVVGKVISYIGFQTLFLGAVLLARGSLRVDSVKPFFGNS